MLALSKCSEMALILGSPGLSMTPDAGTLEPPGLAFGRLQWAITPSGSSQWSALSGVR